MKTAVVINRDSMGHGSEELGAKILKTFFSKAGTLRTLDAIVFYNSGVRILVEGSEYLPVLDSLHHHGVDLIACGTCVDHYDIRDEIRIASVKGMDDILSALESAEKVVTL